MERPQLHFVQDRRDVLGGELMSRDAREITRDLPKVLGAPTTRGENSGGDDVARTGLRREERTHGRPSQRR